MNGWCLRFYVHEGQRHHGMLLWEWLLTRADGLGVRGGSAFRALAGFGRHHVLHEQTFFELAGSTAVEIEFIVTEQEAQQLLTLLRTERLRLFYTRSPAEFGVLNPDTEDAPDGSS